jgi:hypothetical protein
MTSKENKLKHLAWTINSRHLNQACSLRLLTLFEIHEATWKTKKFSRAAQDLMAVAFSLWRAAFLADKTGKRGVVFAEGRNFLERLIEDNAIAYLQDKASKEWTFNYYTRNARSSLQILNQYWPDEVPPYGGQKRGATERWDYCQQLLEAAVTGFERRLAAKELLVEHVEKAKSVRASRKKRRAIVRSMTLAERDSKKSG